MFQVAIVLCMTLAASPASFDVQTLDGDTATGTVVSLDGTTLALQTASGVKEIAIKELLAATGSQTTKAAMPRAVVQIELVDGSLVPASDFESIKGAAHFTLPGGAKSELPTRAIRTVRFFDPAESSDKLELQWNEIVAVNPAGDLLVIRKKGAIDTTEGVVGDVSAETVAFTLDGDVINVKRPKIEGIVFAQPAVKELPETICTLAANSAALLKVAELKLSGDAVEVTTPAGYKTSLPLAEVVKFDFSSGKVLFLSDQEPESFTFQPFFATEPELAALSEFYRLRRDIGLEKQPLKLDGRAYRKGIALHSRSTVVYRLPGKFRFFKAIVGIDDAARDGGGDVAVTIRGDGKPLWEGNVRAADKPQSLELDIAGVKKLEIVADYGGGQDVADHLDLCDAKVTK